MSGHVQSCTSEAMSTNMGMEEVSLGFSVLFLSIKTLAERQQTQERGGSPGSSLPVSSLPGELGFRLGKVLSNLVTIAYISVY